MKDITERLREHGYKVSFDAAAEIERLRAALTQIAGHAPVTYVGQNKVDYSCQRIAREAIDQQSTISTEK